MSDYIIIVHQAHCMIFQHGSEMAHWIAGSVLQPYDHHRTGSVAFFEFNWQVLYAGCRAMPSKCMIMALTKGTSPLRGHNILIQGPCVTCRFHHCACCSNACYTYSLYTAIGGSKTSSFCISAAGHGIWSWWA